MKQSVRRCDPKVAVWLNGDVVVLPGGNVVVIGQLAAGIVRLKECIACDGPTGAIRALPGLANFFSTRGGDGPMLPIEVRDNLLMVGSGLGDDRHHAFRAFMRLAQVHESGRTRRRIL